MRNDFRGWIPCQLQRDTRDCRWLYVGSERFTAPSFEETISRCLGLPENSFGPPQITPLKELPAIASSIDALDPSALIFHVSRCGSTLVTQLLALDDSCVTLAEVPFFDVLLRARFQPDLAGAVDVATQLPAAIRLHGQRRFGTERSLVVKLDSWHTGFHAELRAVYPRTPFVLLYRNPVEVVRSHQKRPGMHAVRGLIEDVVFRFSAQQSADTHLPSVLEFYYRAFLEIARSDPRALLVRYEPNMIPIVEQIARFASVEISTTHREKMLRRAAFHAKQPNEQFREAPIESAPDDKLQQCVARYEELERFVTSRSSL